MTTATQNVETTGPAQRVAGLHHVTAIASSAQRVHDFQTKALGLRLVKKTVNFDDPSAYHLYYGDTVGSPGSAMTYFPWASAPRGQVGVGQSTLTHYSAPEGSLGAWRRRLEAHEPTLGLKVLGEEAPFGQERLVALDPDGAPFAIVAEAGANGVRTPWLGAEAPSESLALRGFHGVTLAVEEAAPMARVLTDLLGYRQTDEEAAPMGRRLRFEASEGGARVVDIHEATGLVRGRDGAGITHHVAFSTPNRETQAEIRQQVLKGGLAVTPVVDRDYFHAIYFRTPGGILFEVATDAPGFTRDEDPAHLGEALKLPAQHEPRRAAIEAALDPLNTGPAQTAAADLRSGDLKTADLESTDLESRDVETVR